MKKIRKPEIKKKEWIPVKQGLPADFEDVVVQSKDGEIWRSLLYDGEFRPDNSREVVAWRRFPTIRAKKLRRKQIEVWVNVYKKKPAYEQCVFVQYENGVIRIDYISSVIDSFVLESLYGKALYWMPLPEPYISKDGGIEHEEN